MGFKGVSLCGFWGSQIASRLASPAPEVKTPCSSKRRRVVVQKETRPSFLLIAIPLESPQFSQHPHLSRTFDLYLVDPSGGPAPHRCAAPPSTTLLSPPLLPSSCTAPPVKSVSPTGRFRACNKGLFIVTPTLVQRGALQRLFSVLLTICWH